MIRLKHEMWGIPGHLLHSSFQSLTISPTSTSCIIANLGLPSLTDMMNFLQGIFESRILWVILLSHFQEEYARMSQWVRKDASARSRRPGQVFLKVVIPQATTYLQQRKLDWQGLLESVLSSHPFRISSLHYMFPSVKGLGVGPFIHEPIRAAV
jgi:hypothetical protein